MNRIRGYHVAYPPRAPEPEPAPPMPLARCAAIDAAIINRTPTAEIIAALGATNEYVQQRKRRLRKKGKLK